MVNLGESGGKSSFFGARKSELHQFLLLSSCVTLIRQGTFKTSFLFDKMKTVSTLQSCCEHHVKSFIDGKLVSGKKLYTNVCLFL